MVSEEEKLTSESKRIADELDRVVSSIDALLRRIEDAVLSGTLDLERHVENASIWNNIGLYCLRNSLPNTAETIYKAMLRTIRKYENRKKTSVYKGLALNNLGIAFYLRGEYKEAKRALEKAVEEDRRIYGEQASEKGMAISALSELSFPKGSQEL